MSVELHALTDPRHERRRSRSRKLPFGEIETIADAALSHWDENFDKREETKMSKPCKSGAASADGRKRFVPGFLASIFRSFGQDDFKTAWA